ncbi:MAG: hypothetical protein Q7K57_44165 [Burkholderiaceae bacterium]|nr:hypothetical protein [Burkholderiaceae bacterium]
MSSSILLLIAIVSLGMLSQALGWAKESSSGGHTEAADDRMPANEHLEDDQDGGMNPDHWLERGESPTLAEPVVLHYWAEEEK